VGSWDSVTRSNDRFLLCMLGREPLVDAIAATATAAKEKMRSSHALVHGEVSKQGGKATYRRRQANSQDAEYPESNSDSDAVLRTT
jgi:hypothetical protein